MARTLLDIDRDLLEQAKEVLGEPTFTATVNTALRQVIAARAHEEFIQEMSALDDEQRDAMRAAKAAW